MRVLVTGGAGFIGSALVRACLEEGDQVRVLDDLSTGRESNLDEVRDALEFVKGSVSDLQTVEEAIRGSDVVFHHAAQPSVVQSLENPLHEGVAFRERTLAHPEESGLGSFASCSPGNPGLERDRVRRLSRVDEDGVQAYSLSMIEAEFEIFFNRLQRRNGQRPLCQRE